MEEVERFKDVSLVVLAAGMGSRFGGLKQLFPVGAKRQTILEYTLDDAQALGIRKVVFLIRKSIDVDFRDVILNKMFRRPFEVKLAYQEFDALPEGFAADPQREKPLGTGHALWVALKSLRTPNAVVVNADDYYGPNALRLAAKAAAEGRNAIVAYELMKTLSPFGPVSRGVLQIADGKVAGITEKKGLTISDAPEGYASMNCMSVAPSLRAAVEQNIQSFCTSGAVSSLDAECQLPDAIRLAIESGVAVEALPTTDPWMGLTHREDAKAIEFKIGRVELVEET